MYVLTQPDAGSHPKLQNLPDECIREVILRLADHKDIESCSKAYNVMTYLCDEHRIWRELCYFHFSRRQINFVLDSSDEEGVVATGSSTTIDWQCLYHKLRK